MMKHRMPRFAVVGAALAIGLLASTVEAQGRPQGGEEHRGGRGERFDPAQRLEQRVSFLTQQLQLSSSQQTQVRSILTEEQNAMQALRPTGGREDRPAPRGAGRDSARLPENRRLEFDARRDSVHADAADPPTDGAAHRRCVERAAADQVPGAPEADGGAA